MLVKIAPDLHDEDVRAVAQLAIEVGLAGVIATNTTISRPDSLAARPAQIAQIGAGGLSGPDARRTLDADADGCCALDLPPRFRDHQLRGSDHRARTSGTVSRPALIWSRAIPR